MVTGNVPRQRGLCVFAHEPFFYLNDRKQGMEIKKGGDQGQSIPVWDFPTRAFHWSLVILIGWEWASSHLGGRFMTYHMWGGYAVFALILFRLTWGFIGSRTARFSHFMSSPRRTWDYIKSWRSHLSRGSYGHNPVGSWSVAAFLVSLSVQVGTGLFATDDVLTSGPLNPLVRNRTADWLTDIHKANFDILLGLIGAHILAILAHRLIGGHNLVKPMITGRAPANSIPTGAVGQAARPWLGIVALMGAITATWFIVHA
jgi:cytochrome b